MGETFLNRIHSQSYKFTNSEKIICDYIMNNFEISKKSTIRELAKATDTSAATISRFAKKLGYENFHDMKLSLYVLGSENKDNNEEIFFKDVTKENSNLDLVHYTFSTAQRSLQDTANIMNPDTIDRAVKVISKSNIMAVFSLGGSSVVGLNAYHRFMRTSVNCLYSADFHMQLINAGRLDKNDCALVISHSGKNKDILRIMDILKVRNVKTIVITSNPHSPIAENSTILLTSISEETTHRPEAVSSMVSQIVIVDSLFTIYALKIDNSPHYFSDIRDIINSTRKDS